MEDILKDKFFVELIGKLRSSLSLRQYLHKAWQLCEDPEIVRQNEHRWVSPLWEFTRYAKAHPELCDLDADAALREVESRWLRKDRWTGRFAVGSDEDARIEFLANWDKIRSLPGWDSVESAVQKAREAPLRLELPRTEGYVAFVSTAYWLSRSFPTFFLPCRKLAKHLNVSAETISRYRHFAIKDGYLKVERAHRFRSHGQRSDATEFSFCWERAS